MMGKQNLQLDHLNLTEFFYKNLNELNRLSSCPLPEEIIFYSSKILDKYSLSSEFFGKEQGRVINKQIGFSYLESRLKPKEERIEILKDVGDSVLIQLGFFSDSIQKKKISKQYYINIGKNAYSELSNLDYRFYDIPNFFKQLSSCYDYLISLLARLNERTKFETVESYLISGDIKTTAQ